MVGAPDPAHIADTRADVPRLLSRAYGALLTVAVSIETGTANDLDPEKLRQLADACRVARRDMRLTQYDECDHPIEAVLPNKDRRMECRQCGILIGAHLDGSRGGAENSSITTHNDRGSDDGH